MSTLLTPIITQMELDRDRFKDLVNGTASETVDLEGRTEKSIAGQVEERFNQLTFDFTTAKDEVVSLEAQVSGYKDDVVQLKSDTQQLHDDTLSYKIEAEGARDQTISQSTDVQTWWSDVNTKHDTVVNKASEVSSALITVTSLESDAEGHKDAALTYKNSAQQAAVEAATTADQVRDITSESSKAFDEPLALSPSPLYPSSGSYIDETLDTVLIGGSPRPIADAIFLNRKFIVEEYDSVAEQWNVIDTFTGQALDYTVTSGSLDNTKDYRWKCEDTFQAIDTSQTKTYQTRTCPWVDLTFESTGNDEYKRLDTPSVNSVSLDGLSGEIVLSPIDPTSDAQLTLVTVKNIDNGTYFTTQSKKQDIGGSVDMTTISLERLSPNTEYEVMCLYRGKSPEIAYTPWSDAFTFTTEQGYTGLVYKSKETTTLDYKEGIKLHSVVMSNNPSITLTDPDVGEYVELLLYVDGGDSDGTITIPSKVKWNGGSFGQSTDLGNTWTLISFKWVGEWIGKVESSD